MDTLERLWQAGKEQLDLIVYHYLGRGDMDQDDNVKHLLEADREMCANKFFEE